MTDSLGALASTLGPRTRPPACPLGPLARRRTVARLAV
jgi:hypothetical protein